MRLLIVILILTLTIIILSCSTFDNKEQFENCKRIGVYQDSVIKVTLYQDTLSQKDKDSLSFPIEIEVIKQNSIILIKNDFATNIKFLYKLINDTLYNKLLIGHYENGIIQNYWFKRLNYNNLLKTSLKITRNEIIETNKEETFRVILMKLIFYYVELNKERFKEIKIENKIKDLYNIYTDELPFCDKLTMEFTLDNNFK